jgi:uncharacterized RDD family membrane protein YckC
VTSPPPGYPPGQFPPPGYYPPPPGYRPAPPPPVSPGGQPLASFVDRLLAYLIDAAIFTGAALVIALPAFLIYIFAVMVPQIEADPYATGSDAEVFKFLVPLLLLEAAFIVISIVLAYVYYVEMMLRSGGQTVGKKVMKIQIIPLDPARKLDRPMAAKRFLVQHIAAIFVPFFSYIDGFWQLWDKPFQQCLHDKFAQTVVVKVVPR